MSLICFVSCVLPTKARQRHDMYLPVLDLFNFYAVSVRAVLRALLMTDRCVINCQYVSLITFVMASVSMSVCFVIC